VSALLSALRDEIRSIVREEIRAVRASTAVEPDVYSTAPGGILPPVRMGETRRRSRRWTREHAPKIPGAVRTGPSNGPAVVWTISRIAYETWLAARTTIATPTEHEKSASNVVNVDDWIASAGYRATRRASR
jgi:hypothetical protein